MPPSKVSGSMKKLLLFLIIGFSSGLTLSIAYASLTFNATSVTSDSNLTLTGSGSSTLDIGAGTLSIQTTNNGPITAGNGLFTVGGTFKLNNLTASQLLGTDANKNATSVAIGSYLSLAGGTLSASSTLASSSVSFIFQNATTTKPNSFEDILTNTAKTISYVDCFEYAAATTTMELYYNTTNASTGIQQVILSSIACGIGGNSTTSFTTSTLPAGAYLFAIVSSMAGSSTQTTLNVSAFKL